MMSLFGKTTVVVSVVGFQAEGAVLKSYFGLNHAENNAQGETSGEIKFWEDLRNSGSEENNNQIYLENDSTNPLDKIVYMYLEYENQTAGGTTLPAPEKPWAIVSGTASESAITLSDPIPHYAADCTVGTVESYNGGVQCAHKAAAPQGGMTCKDSQYCKQNYTKRRTPSATVGAGTWQILELPQGASVQLLMPNFSSNKAVRIFPLKYRSLPLAQAGDLCIADTEHLNEQGLPTMPAEYCDKETCNCPCDPKYQDCGQALKIETGRDMVGNMSAVDGVNFNARYTMTHSQAGSKKEPTTIDFSGNPCKALNEYNTMNGLELVDEQGCVNVDAGSYKAGNFKDGKIAGENTSTGWADFGAFSPCWHATCNLKGAALLYCDAVHADQCSNSTSSKMQNLTNNTQDAHLNTEGKDPKCMDKDTNKQVFFTTYCYDYDDQNSSPNFGYQGVYMASFVFSNLK